MKLLALLIFVEGVKQLTELESFWIAAQASGFSGSSMSFFHIICFNIKERCFQKFSNGQVKLFTENIRYKVDFFFTWTIMLCITAYCMSPKWCTRSRKYCLYVNAIFNVCCCFCNFYCPPSYCNVKGGWPLLHYITLGNVM